MFTTIRVRLLALLCLFFVGLTGVVLTSVHLESQAIYGGREARLNNLLDLATSALDEGRELVESGKLNEDEARRIVFRRIGSMRFGNGNYFLIMDSNYQMLVHPNPTLVGQDQSKVADGLGSLFNLEVIPRALAEGSASIIYNWPRASGGESIRKLGLYRLYKPWGIIVSTGVYLDDLDETIRSAALTLVAIAGLIVLFTLLVAAIIVRSVASPLGDLRIVMLRLAEGATKLGVPHLRNKGEIGSMARAVEVLRLNAIERERDIAERASAHAEKLARAERLDSAVSTFRHAAGDIAEAVAAASIALHATAGELDAASKQTAHRSAAALRVAEEAVSGSGMALGGAQDLSSSFHNVSEAVASSLSIAADALNGSRAMREVMDQLVAAVGHIEGTVTLVAKLASQTSLLALNATIESARAGEAGRGFGVVATEVKELAKGVSSATSEITGRIAEVRRMTELAGSVLDGVSGSIRQIDGVTRRIDDATGQHRVETSKIVAAIEAISTATHAVCGDVEELAQAAGDSGSVAHHLFACSTDLTVRAKDLKGQVSRYLDLLAAA